MRYLSNLTGFENLQVYFVNLAKNIFMKRIILLFTILLPFFAMAQTSELKSFDEVMNALKEGKELQSVLYYNDCQFISDNEIQEKGVDAIGGMSIATWEYFAEGAVRNKQAFVVTSSYQLIANPLGEGYVYNYVKLKISADGKVKITANYINSLTHEEIMSENMFTTIHDGKEGAAHFFVK